jgi:hypothetical protein
MVSMFRPGRRARDHLIAVLTRKRRVWAKRGPARPMML